MGSSIKWNRGFSLEGEKLGKGCRNVGRNVWKYFKVNDMDISSDVDKWNF